MEKLSPEQQERLQEYLETRKISKYRIAHDLNLSARRNPMESSGNYFVTIWEFPKNGYGQDKIWSAHPMMKLPLKRLRPQTVWKQL